MRKITRHNLALVAGILAGIVFFAAAPLFALARGYMTDDAMLKPGMIVAVTGDSENDKAKVERASNENPYAIIGVATNPSDTQVTIASENQEVYVESNGDVTAYVSDVEGEVKKGDRLTISPLRGILSKAPERPALLLGIALEDMATKETEEYTITTPDGDKKVKVAQVLINYDRKPGSSEEPDSSLERLGRSISGKDVGEIRVMAAIIIFLIVLIAEASILYGAISSAITSLGRNPLARQIIKHELLRVVIVAFAVLIFGLGSIYLILWV